MAVSSEQGQAGRTSELAQTPAPMGRIPQLALHTGDARDADWQPRDTTRTVPTTDRSIHPRAGGEAGRPLIAIPLYYPISSPQVCWGLPFV